VRFIVQSDSSKKSWPREDKRLPPLSPTENNYVVKHDIGGIPHDVRCLTVAVYKRAVESAIGRGLLRRSDRTVLWTVISASFAGMFDDHAIEWLSRHGYLNWGQRGQGEAIIAAVNALIGRQR
jgi:hypothetical protein